MTEKLSIEELVLKAGVWHVGNERMLASGEISNHHLDMPRILDDPEVRDPFLQALGSMALQYEPDALWGVPTGGQRFAEELGGRLDIEVVRLEAFRNDPWTKLFRYASPQDKKLAETCKTMVGIEDLTRKMTSLLKALSSNREIADKTVALAAGWRRGTPGQERWFAVPVHWVIEQPLPNNITPDHPFYQRYSRYAQHE